MRYKYKVLQDVTLPHPEKRNNPDTPIMDNRDMELWLDTMDEEGWEFVGCGQKEWKGSNSFTQTFWIFRKPRE